METSQIIALAIQLLLFLASSYLLFYKSFVKALGKETAKLVTAEQLTSIKESVKTQFKEGLELYKSNLSEQLSNKIEPLKSELAKNNIAYQIQFGHLHQKRADVVVAIHGKLVEIYEAMADWTSQFRASEADPDEGDKKRLERVNQSLIDFGIYYRSNKLYFTEAFCADMEALFSDSRSKSWEYAFKQSRLKQASLLTPKDASDYYKELIKISNDIRDQIPKKLLEIEREFRKLLGVEQPAK